MLSKPEFYYWYLIPTILGGLAIIWSLIQTGNNREYTNVGISVFILLSIGLSQIALIQIFFFDAWPTFFPHIATIFSLILVLLQYYRNGRRKSLLQNMNNNTYR